jgi:hypothetical protein
MIPRASHLFFTDQPEVAHRTIMDFLAVHSDVGQTEKAAC